VCPLLENLARQLDLPIFFVLPNLTVLTGGAEYGRPLLQGILEVP